MFPGLVVTKKAAVRLLCRFGDEHKSSLFLGETPARVTAGPQGHGVSSVFMKLPNCFFNHGFHRLNIYGAVPSVYCIVLESGSRGSLCV